MKRILFAALAASCTLFAAQPTAKTFFKQSNWPTWQSPLPETSHNWCISPSDDFITTDLHAQAFYFHSREKDKLGKYFGFFHDASATIYPFLRVDADDAYSGLRPQDIIHDAANADRYDDPAVAPLAQTLTFAPTIKQYGFCITNTISIGEKLTIQTIMPWTSSTHSLGVTTSGTGKQEVESKIVTVADWFEGTVHQEEGTNPNQQDKLIYGKIVDKVSRNGLADITVQALFHPIKHESTTFGIGGFLTVPTSSRAQGHQLFEPVIGTGGHTVLGITGRVATRAATLANKFPLYVSADATLRVGLAAHEVRSPSYTFAYDNGVDAQFARYALGGKKHARRLFPLINVLTQGVRVKPGTVFDIGAGFDLHTRVFRWYAEYRFTHTQKELVEPLVQWPANTYSLARLDYAQTTTAGDVTTYHTFDMTDDASLLTGSLDDARLLFEAAATPAQTTHTISGGASLFPMKRFPFTSVGLFARYHFTAGSQFGVAGYTLSATLSHSF